MRRLRFSGLILSFFWLSGTVHAVDWLMMQGAEHPLAPAHKILAFVQPAFSFDFSNELSGLTDIPGPPDFSVNNGERLANTTVSPWFSGARRLHLRSAKVGARGVFTGALRNRLTAKMNYLVLFELAPNLLTYQPFGDRFRTVAVDHFSLTFNHVPAARLRLGLFKTPGPEESFQPVQRQDYIEFSDFIARGLLERFVTGAARPAGSPDSPVLGTAKNAAYGINGFRDWGVQLFSTKKLDAWALSYALMLGRGEAISASRNSDGDVDLYLYASAERSLPGGWRVFKNGIKFYAWYQSGNRSFETDSAGQSYRRSRYGIGTKWLGAIANTTYRYRLAFDLMVADGMIFIAPAGGVANGNIDQGNIQIAAESGNRSYGMTADFGFYLNNKWQLDFRAHRHDLLRDTATRVDPGNRRKIDEFTFGASYHLSRKMRLTANYVIRNVSAPTRFRFTPVADGLTENARRIVDTVENRLLLQFTLIY